MGVGILGENGERDYGQKGCAARADARFMPLAVITGQFFGAIPPATWFATGDPRRKRGRRHRRKMACAS